MGTNVPRANAKGINGRRAGGDEEFIQNRSLCVGGWGGRGQSRRTVLKGLKQSVRRMNGTDGERNESNDREGNALGIKTGQRTVSG